MPDRFQWLSQLDSAPSRGRRTGAAIRGHSATETIFWLIPEKINVIRIRFVAKHLRCDPLCFLLVRPLRVGELMPLGLEIYAVKYLLGVSELFGQRMRQYFRVYFKTRVDSNDMGTIMQVKAASQNPIAQPFCEEYRSR